MRHVVPSGRKNLQEFQRELSIEGWLQKKESTNRISANLYKHRKEIKKSLGPA